MKYRVRRCLRWFYQIQLNKRNGKVGPQFGNKLASIRRAPDTRGVTGHAPEVWPITYGKSIEIELETIDLVNRTGS